MPWCFILIHSSRTQSLLRRHIRCPVSLSRTRPTYSTVSQHLESASNLASNHALWPFLLSCDLYRQPSALVISGSDKTLSHLMSSFLMLPGPSVILNISQKSNSGTSPTPHDLKHTSSRLDLHNRHPLSSFSSLSSSTILRNLPELCSLHRFIAKSMTRTPSDPLI